MFGIIGAPAVSNAMQSISIATETTTENLVDEASKSQTWQRHA